MPEEIARHLVELGLRWCRDDHAEIERIALEFRLHRELFDLLAWVPSDEHFLRRLQDVRVLRGEIATRRFGGRGHQQAQRQRWQKIHSHANPPLVGNNPQESLRSSWGFKLHHSLLTKIMAVKSAEFPRTPKYPPRRCSGRVRWP